LSKWGRRVQKISVFQKKEGQRERRVAGPLGGQGGDEGVLQRSHRGRLAIQFGTGETRRRHSAYGGVIGVEKTNIYNYVGGEKPRGSGGFDRYRWDRWRPEPRRGIPSGGRGGDLL